MPRQSGPRPPPGPVPMPWVMSGFTQAESLWTTGLTAWVGTTGLGVIIFSCSFVIALLVDRHGDRIWGPALAAAVILSAAPAPEGSPGQAAPPHSASTELLSVSVIQPGWSPKRWADLDAPGRNDSLLSLIGEGPRSVDLFLMPETALVGERSLSEVASGLETPILTGAILELEDAFSNAALMAQPFGPIARYEKEILVPFAEYAPLSDRIPVMNRLAVPSGGVRSYVPGRRKDPMIVEGIRIQPLICFESLFARLIQPDASLIVVLTQDGWWNSDWARRQHFLYSRMLALQAGIPLIQASVDGTSGAFAADGSLLSAGTNGKADRLTLTVPLNRRYPLYASTGDWPVLIILALSAIYLTVRAFRPG